MIDRNGKKIYNCPNCAAPIGYSPKCEYCGTVLRWIPTCEIKPILVNVQKLAAEVVVDKMFLKIYPDSSLITERLKGALAEKLPKVWTVTQRDDVFIRGGIVFRAEILIGRKDDG